MTLSKIGQKLTTRTGILELMEDLGRSLNNKEHQYMLGGGNPALIPEVCALWRERMQAILANGDQFELMTGSYDTAKGNLTFQEAMAELLSRTYGWNITHRNIAVTNGSQIGFFYLLNMFGGTYADGSKRKILFPICPEYIGYADQSIEAGIFVSRRPAIDQIDPCTFKYRVDFPKLEIGDDIAAICVSRPTNPTGNVLTDSEIRHLADLAGERSIPLIIDNAYGLPFPGIIFEDVQPFWNEHVILSMSLSKIGLPSVRNGIIIAGEEIIEAISAANAICSLATGSIGQAILEPLVRSGEILNISQNVVRPFYQTRAARAIEWVREALDGVCDFSIHKAEGALFLWIWFKNLPVSTSELYLRLKKRNVLVIPGKHFFFGLEEAWEHEDECIRVNYSQNEEDVRAGIFLIADVIRSL